MYHYRHAALFDIYVEFPYNVSVAKSHRSIPVFSRDGLLPVGDYDVTLAAEVNYDSNRNRIPGSATSP